MSGHCSTKRADSLSQTDQERETFKFSAQTERPSIQTIGSNALLEKGL